MPRLATPIRHRITRWPALLAIAAVISCIVASSHCLAQNSSQNSTSKDQTKAAAASDGKKSDPGSPPLDPAQAQLAADTQKLLKLSEELKAEVAKSNKDTLSIAVVKKADEVEQLAKSIKDRINKSPKH